MSQKAFLQDFDRMAAGAFAAAGIADANAKYTAKPGDPAIDCTVFVDRDVHQFGDDPMPAAANVVVVSFFRSEVTPAKGGIVQVDGDTYRLGDKVGDDGSRVRFLVVAHG